MVIHKEIKMNTIIRKQTLQKGLFLFLFAWAFSLQAQITLVVSSEGPSCSNYTNGTASAEAAGGTAPYTYNWSNGSSGSTIYGLTGGSYTVSATDAEGAVAVASVDVSAPAPLLAEISFIGDACTASMGGLTGSAEGGTPPYSYSWSDGSAGETIFGVTPGGYTLTVLDANGCHATAYYQFNAPLSVTVSTIDVVCNGFCDASAEAIITGGTAPYETLWNNGSTSTVNFPLPVGEYCVTVTDGNGCVQEACGTIGEPDELIATITLSGDCDNNSDISADVSIEGGVGGYEILWNTGATGTTITDLEAGETYRVTVTDANGCNDTESVTVGDITQLAITVSGDNETCAGDNDGSATVTPGGGEAPYTIVWSTGDSEATIEDLEPGDYGVTVTDSNGCTGEQTITVDPGTTIAVSTETTASACGTTGTGSLTITPSGGIPPYFFLYENGIGNPASGVVENLQAGAYQVTVGDAMGCTTITVIDVDQIDGFTISGTGENASCPDAADGTASVNIGADAVEPVTILWSNDASTENISGLAPGEYTVTVTDANDCVDVTTVTVGAEADIEASFELAVDNCEGTILTVSVTGTSGDVEYNYTVGTQTFTDPNFTFEIPAGESVEVALMVQDGVCDDSVAQTFEASPIDATVPAEAEACQDDPLSLSASSSQEVDYSWSSPDNILVGATDIANPDVNTSVPGVYTAEVTITNTVGCSLTEEVMITVTDAEITVDPALIETAQNCEDFTIIFTDNNANADSFEWIFNGTDVVPGGSEVTYQFPESGTFEVVLNPTLSCAEPVTIEVEVEETEEVDFTFEVDCENAYTVNFTDQSSNPGEIASWEWVIDGVTYNEQNPSVSFDEDAVIEAELTVTYNNDCVLTDSEPIEIDIFNPTLPNNQLISCPESGEISLFEGADANLDYQWSGDNFESDLPNPSVDVTETSDYNVTITDPVTMCTVESEVTVTVPDALPSPMLEDITVCEETTGSADATVAGGVNYTWSDTEDFSNTLSENPVYDFPVTTEPTTYYVLITDANECETTAQLTVGAYPVDLEFGEVQLVCNGTAPVINIDPDLDITWAGADPTGVPIFENSFFVGTVSNEFGCTATDTLTVEAVRPEGVLDIMAEPDTILLGDVSQINVTERPDYSYLWDNDGTLSADDIANPIASPEETTTYTVTVTDERDCTGSLDVTIVVETSCEDFLYFPNAFTPNDDGLNDVLFVEGLSLDEVFFAIYNRWGEKVYESNDITEGWNGEHKGELVCPDVYGYYLRVRCTDGTEIFRKGNVSVLR